MTNLYRAFWEEGRPGYAIKSTQLTFPGMAYDQVIGLLTGELMLVGDTRGEDKSLTLVPDPNVKEYQSDRDFLSPQVQADRSVNTLVYASASLAQLNRLKRMLFEQIKALGLTPAPALVAVTSSISLEDKLEVLDEMANEALCDELGYDYNKAVGQFQESIAEALLNVKYLAPLISIDPETITDEVCVAPNVIDDFYFRNRIEPIAYKLMQQYRSFLEGQLKESASPRRVEAERGSPDYEPLVQNKTDSCWLGPDGRSYPCEYAGHLRLAEVIAQRLYPEVYEKGLEDGEAILENRGWIKMSHKRFYYTNASERNPSDRQVEVILDWLRVNNYNKIYWLHRDYPVSEFYELVTVGDY